MKQDEAQTVCGTGQKKVYAYMDESNRSQDWALAGQRADIALPASKGPKVHIIGCKSTN